MGIFDKTALTDRLNDPDNWKGTDDDTPLMRWRIRIKHWFAFSNRSEKGITASFVFFPFLWVFPFTIWFTGWSWWYLFPIAIIPVARKWRKKPKVLWAKKWGGMWRWESLGDAPEQWTTENNPKNFDMIDGDLYFSRVQNKTDACIAIIWPLLVVVHWKKIFFYRGWHFDDDLIYWGDGAGGPNIK